MLIDSPSPDGLLGKVREAYSEASDDPGVPIHSPSGLISP